MLCDLADAIFAYIDELAASSVEGYAQAQQTAAGERERRRRALLAAVLAPEFDADAVDRARARGHVDATARGRGARLRAG